MPNVGLIPRLIKINTMSDKPKVIDRDQEIVFTNFTNLDYEGRWAKKIYEIKAGKSYYLPFYLAEHFGQGLVDRELNRLVEEDKKTWPATIDQKERERRETAIIGNYQLRQQLMDKCVIPTNQEVGIISPTRVPMREVPLKTQQRSADLVDKDPTLANALGPTNQPKRPEDTFEGAQGDQTPPANA